MCQALTQACYTHYSLYLHSSVLRRKGGPALVMGFPGGSAGKESVCNVGDLGSIPGLGRSAGEGKGYPLHILAWRMTWTI